MPTPITPDKTKLEKMYQRIGKKTPDVSKPRRDDRPLYYHTVGEEKVRCVLCTANGITAKYAPPEGFFNDPANSPVIDRATGEPDGGVYTVCKGHLPENVVAFDPATGLCHNKSGTEVWKEEDS